MPSPAPASGVRWSKLFPPEDAPRELPAKSPPPPPSPRPPSRTRSLTTISVMYFFCPVCLSSQEWVRRLPSMYTFAPFLRYSPAISAVRAQAVMLCHSVRSCHCPSLSLIAIVGGQCELRHRRTAGRGPEFGIFAKIADENDFIDAFTCHKCCSFRPFAWTLNRGAGEKKGIRGAGTPLYQNPAGRGCDG